MSDIEQQDDINRGQAISAHSFLGGKTQEYAVQTLANGTSQETPSTENSGLAKVWDYIKSRYEKGNWFGSTVLLFHMSATYQSIRAALARQVHGQKATDHIRAFNGIVGMTGYTWSFLSERGAQFPEGETLWLRVKDTVKHPSRSSSQFEFLLDVTPNLLAAVNNIIKGARAFGISLAPGEEAYTPEKVRLFTGINTMLTHACFGYGHFRKHVRGEHSEVKRENPDVFGGVLPNASSDRSKGVLGTLEKIWNHDRILVVGGLLSAMSTCLQAIEGFMKTARSKEESARLLKSALINIGADASYYYYTFQRVAASNLGTKQKPLAPQQEEAQEMEKDESAPLEKEAAKPFMQRVENSRKESQPRAPMASFAERASTPPSREASY